MTAQIRVPAATRVDGPAQTPGDRPRASCGDPDPRTVNLSLFDVVPHPRARATDTQTALDAARSVTPGRTEARILEAYRQCLRFGLTDDELAVALAPLYAPTVKTCRSRLLRAGLLRDSGRRRPGARGRDQIVWVIA